MEQHDPSAWSHFLALLDSNPRVPAEYDHLRMSVEEVRNFSLERDSVTAEQFAILEKLFNSIIWYSPYPEERARIPNYIGEKEVDLAIAEARRALSAQGTKG